MADHKEYWSTESDQGSIRISEDVVASIAALATSETAGVSGLYSTLTSDIVSFLSKKNLSKGVRIEIGEEGRSRSRSASWRCLATTSVRWQSRCRRACGHRSNP